jgi:hypothetical protein
VLPALAVTLAVSAAAYLPAGMIHGEHVQAMPALEPAGDGEDVRGAHVAVPGFVLLR